MGHSPPPVTDGSQDADSSQGAVTASRAQAVPGFAAVLAAPRVSTETRSLWQDAFPDNRCTINVAVAEGNEAVQESVFTGTHTETFHVPGSPDIPATGKSVAIPIRWGSLT